MTAIPLLVAVLILAAASGAAVLKGMRLDIPDTRARLTYGIPLGLGIIAHLVLLLGLVGLLTTGAVCGGLIVLAFASVPGFKDLLQMQRQKLSGSPSEPSSRTPFREESGTS